MRLGHGMSRAVSSLVEDQINEIPVNNKVDEIHHKELFFSLLMKIIHNNTFSFFPITIHAAIPLSVGFGETTVIYATK
jgi:hypothetical protein